MVWALFRAVTEYVRTGCCSVDRPTVCPRRYAESARLGYKSTWECDMTGTFWCRGRRRRTVLCINTLISIVRFEMYLTDMQRLSLILYCCHTSVRCHMATADDSSPKARSLLGHFEGGHTLLASNAAYYIFGITDSLSCSLQPATVWKHMEAVPESII
jgi:hypothetical protein